MGQWDYFCSSFCFLIKPYRGWSKWWIPLKCTYCSIPLKLAYNEKKLYKTLDYWSRDMVNLDFLGKRLGIVSPLHSVYEFSKKCFLCSINWPNFIIWLPFLFGILGNMCIAIVCFTGFYIINFELNLIFLINPFFYKTKKSRQKFKYLENERNFYGEIKSICHHF